ncbi:MAG: aminoglycoside phosphotransferase family protein [Candidatus Levybacteria bacterium]|nr:aminoglycoside phosphotransferase family protein [Candidatus Levybacteria bacterium]
MAHNIESLLARHLPHGPDGYRYSKQRKGISNESYQIDNINSETLSSSVVLTVIRDPSLWWKVQQEFSVREIIKGDKDVLIPKIFDAGLDDIDGERFAFILREHIVGEDLHTILQAELPNENRENNVHDLALDLGYRLGALHRHRTSIYGLIGRDIDKPFSTWREYVLHEIDKESELVTGLAVDRQIGTVKAGDIVKMLPNIHTTIGALESSLSEFDTPSVGHGDAHFGNFIADSKSNMWKIRGLIDIDEAVSGDPEIDIAFIENWLHFFPYKDEFYRQSEAFQSGYNQVRKISPKYAERRLIYHAFRSLAYLRTVFNLDSNEFNGDSQNQEYVRKHTQILRSIGDNNSLEDLKIRSLM